MKKFLMLIIYSCLYFVVSSQTLEEVCVAVIKDNQQALEVYKGLYSAYNRGFENQRIELNGKTVFAGSKAVDNAVSRMTKYMLKVLEDIEAAYGLKIPDKLSYSYYCILSYIANVADTGIPILFGSIPVKRPIQDHIKLLPGSLDQKIKTFSDELNDPSIIWSYPAFISKSYNDMVKEMKSTFK